MFTLDRSKNDTSVVLDLLRALAAQMVCVGHAFIFFREDLLSTRLPLAQNVGVLIFFLISGFVITYTLIERSKDASYDFTTFFIERFARIYSGLVPALIFIVIVDGIVILWDPTTPYAVYYNLKTFIANLAMLESYRGIWANRLQWPAFGSASPLWTLAIEFHIYIFVASIFFIAARRQAIPWLIPVALFFGQVPIHFLFGAYQPDGLGRGLFWLWLAGAYVLFAVRAFRPPLWTGILLALAAPIAYLAMTRRAAEYDLRGYAVLTAGFFAIIATTQHLHVVTSPRVIRAIQFVAGYSFTLYLVHYTIMYGTYQLWPQRGAGGLPALFLTIILSNVIAATMAIFTEMRHRKLARWLLSFKPGAPQYLRKDSAPRSEDVPDTAVEANVVPERDVVGRGRSASAD